MKTFADLDGPPRLPFIGNAHRLRPEAMQTATEQWASRYGPLYRIQVGPVKMAVLSDADAIAALYGERPDRFKPLRKLQSAVDEIGARGLFVSEGEGWRRQRALVETGLNAISPQACWPGLVRILGRMKRRLQTDADRGGEIDLSPHIDRLTVDMAAELVLGSGFDAAATEEAPLAALMDRLGAVLTRRLYAPVWYWRWFRLPWEHGMYRQIAELREQIHALIRETRQRLKTRSPAAPAYFLEAALANMDKGACPGFSDAELFANSASLLMESYSTLPGTLGWLVCFLLQHPHYREKIRAEIAEHGEPTDSPAHPVAFDRCPWLCAFIDETLRLKPPVTFSALEPVEDSEILGCTLRKGTMILVLHRHPALQRENFADPGRFAPERWLDDPKRRLSGPHNPSAYLRFGSGPRICPGRNHALLQLRAFLAMFAGHIDARLADNGRGIAEVQGLTMKPASLPVELRRAPANARTSPALPGESCGR